jgi:hypothetical protein
MKHVLNTLNEHQILVLAVLHGQEKNYHVIFKCKSIKYIDDKPPPEKSPAP